MLPNRHFASLPKAFWANVRTISQEVGYTVRNRGIIRVPTMGDIRDAYQRLGLTTRHLVDEADIVTGFGATLLDYFAFRASQLDDYVEPRLMNADRARCEYERLRAKLKPKCPLPMNKQKREKKAPAFLTCIVNMLVEAGIRDLPCDYDPRQLTTITRDDGPLRTLARRVDGAFPSTVNPIAIWEIKEYYYTTTFGSRVADGVYETLLDGLELEELRVNESLHVEHYLMVDAYYTWWDCGKSFLCRIIDMLHMGYVDEVLFGYEVIERLPDIVRRWCMTAREGT